MRYLQPLVLRPCLIPFHAVKSKWEGPHCRVCDVLLLSPHAQQVYGCLPASIGERGTQSLKVHTFILATWRFLRSPHVNHNSASNCPLFVRRGLSGSISGLIQQCKVFSYSYCLLLLLQLRVVASVGEIIRRSRGYIIGWVCVGGAHRFEIQTFRAVNGSDEFTVASCLSDVAFGYRPVTWRLNGLSVDFATNTRFSSSSKADAHSTRFFLQIKSPLSSDNGTVVTCQPDGYKESDAALFIVYGKEMLTSYLYTRS